MSEPIMNPNRKSPESYTPKKPEILNMVKNALKNEPNFALPPECIIKPKEKIAAFSGERWPFSNVEPAVYSALGLLFGRTERRDDAGALVNDDIEYAIHNVLTGHAFGLFYCLPDDSLSMAAYGFTSCRLEIGDYSEDEILTIIKDQIYQGNAVHIDEGNGPFDTLIWGYKDNGRVLLGYKFEHGNDDLNCSYDLNNPVEFESLTKSFSDPALYKANGERSGGITLYQPVGEKLDRDIIYRQALAEGYRMLTRTEPPSAMDAQRVHFGYGQAIYDAWIGQLEQANAENSDKFYFTSPIFPHFIALYENRLQLYKFLSMYGKSCADENLQKAAGVCEHLKNLAVEAAQIGFENEYSNPEILAMTNNERRILLIDLLKKCRALELKIAEQLKLFIGSPKGYTPKKPEIVGMAKKMNNNELKFPPISDFNGESGIFEMPPTRFIGIRHNHMPGESGRKQLGDFLSGTFGSKTWNDVVLTLPNVINNEACDFTCEYVAETDSFSFIVGVFSPAETPVPEGLDCRDVPATLVWVWKKEAGGDALKALNELTDGKYSINHDAPNFPWQAFLRVDTYAVNPIKINLHRHPDELQPEGYAPKKPEILDIAKKAADTVEADNMKTDAETMPEPRIIRKAFTLVGVRGKITDWSNFGPLLAGLYETVNAGLGKIEGLAKPVRMVGFWHMDSLPSGEREYCYFAGVEADTDRAPDGLTVKALPESFYAVFTEQRRGTMGGPEGYGYKWLCASEYDGNEEIPGDFEIFSNTTETGPQCEAEILIPIKPKQPPEGYAPKKPEILDIAKKASQTASLNFPEQFSVTERGVRNAGQHCPHTMAYPTMISALKVFLGMESRVIERDGWLQDLDYYFQMGVTTEGYALFYETPCGYGDDNRWGDRPLRNSLSSEGILYKIAAADDKHIRDDLIDFDTIKAEVCAHLAQDKPLLIIRRNENLLVVGYKAYGDILIAHPFNDGASDQNTAVRLKANCKEYDNWTENLQTVIYINGCGEPAGRGEIIKQTLQIAYEMLTDTKLTCDMNDGRYYYGNALYEKWIARLDNDANYRHENDKHKYLHPEEFDFAERRCYAADFLTECESVYGQGALSVARKAFRDIHDKMWQIHWLAMDENEGKLLERQTRDAVIAILKECRELDLIAAENIKGILERDKIGTEAK